MNAEAHQVIHQVVIARDGAEDLSDQLLLLRDRYVAKPKCVVS
jgi:hypothetical protein